MTIGWRKILLTVAKRAGLSFILGESRHGLAIIQRGMLGVFVADCVHAGSVCLYR
jgi:hypothetical protein